MQDGEGVALCVVSVSQGIWMEKESRGCEGSDLVGSGGLL